MRQVILRDAVAHAVELCVPKKGHGLVFPSTVGTPLSHRNVVRSFKALLKRARLPVGTRLYDLRQCDGATYHSARSARDRDRLRQEVLEDLGWRIHCIWSTDWFRNPEGELRRAVEAIEEARLYVGLPQKNGQSAQGGATAIVRDEQPAVPEAPALPKYKKANFRLTFPELHQASPDWLGDVVSDIVEVESPIHEQELSRRVTGVFSIARIGSRIRSAIEAAVMSAVRRRKVHRSGDFLWHSEMREVHLRDRSELPDASKKVEFIAPEEVEAAIGKVIAENPPSGG